MPKIQNGFQLIELLVVLSLLGIMATFAVPYYSLHLTKIRRLEACTALATLAVAMEAYFVKYYTYQDATLALLRFPEYVAKDSYRLSITLSKNNYVLSAIPSEYQAKHDRCGTLILKANGEKSITGAASLNECW